MTYKALTIDGVLNGLKTIPIEMGQVDFNGLCNAKCWYCPVKYEGNPSEFKHNTSLHDIDLMLSKLKQSNCLKPGFDFIYTSHYNEILLHPQFEGLLELFRKYNFKTMILSNGTPFTPDKVNTVLKYSDVVLGATLNIPDIDKERWSEKAGFSKSVYTTLVRNLQYINEHYPQANIQVNATTNGVTEHGHISSIEEYTRITNSFNELVPNLRVHILGWLSDRAGLLSEHKVLVDKRLVKNRVIMGCNHSHPVGGRIYSWFHINSKGDLFLCCDDYQMKYKFGNLLEDDFDNIWLSRKHAEVILTARKEICVNCSSAETFSS